MRVSQLRPLFSLWLSLLLLASTFAPVAHAQETGIDSIRAEYRDLLDLFYRPIDPRDLVQAGWTALGNDAPRHGAAPPAPLPDLSGDADNVFNTFAAAYLNYLASVPASFSPTIAAGDIQSGMADSLHEQHTHYLPPAIWRAFLSTVGGGQQMVGLGVRLGGDTAGLITETAPGGPADTAGLQAGDVVVGADGKDLTGADAPTVSAALVGPEGATVKITIDRGQGPQTFSVTRGPFYYPPLQSSVLPGGVGYLRLSDFVISGRTLPNGTELLSDLDRRLDDLDAQGAQGLILDLRNNGGGSVQTADEILGRFLPDTVRSIRESDERGHESFDIASGRIHARQLPMAVLINGESASASEVTAAALRDAHRAVLVGQKTAGAVASSELLPLPGGAGVQIAVATASAPDSNVSLDGVGVTPDVVTAESRTLADYRSGRDPQLDTAVAALASAPSPPALNPVPAAISPSDLDLLLSAALPSSTDMPMNDRFTQATQWQRLDYTHPNEWIDQNAGAPDPVALQQTLRSRGYQGTVMGSYGGQPGDLPSVSVNADLYASADGAHGSLSTNDLPQLQQAADVPIQLGDEIVAYRGTWLATGSTLLIWRRGRVVFTVAYSDVPGFDRPDTLSAVAQLVDSRAQQLSIP
jgi:carboxyl-terminal processing protease